MNKLIGKCYNKLSGEISESRLCYMCGSDAKDCGHWDVIGLGGKNPVYEGNFRIYLKSGHIIVGTQDRENIFEWDSYKGNIQTVKLLDNYSEDDIDYTNPANVAAGKKSFRTRWNNNDIKGMIAEMWVATKLRNDGYKIRKITKFDWDTNKLVYDDEGIINFLKDFPKNKNIIKLLRDIKVGLPDLICLKDNKLSFIEVKSNTSQVNENQRITIDNMKRKGYNVCVKSVKVNFDVVPFES